MLRSSPCIGLCQLDQSSDYCVGCARASQEIANWRHASETTLQQIWAALPARRAKLGIRLYALGWTREEIRSFIASTLRPEAGKWVFGVHGAVAEFRVASGAATDLDLGPTCLVATTADARVRFEVSRELRALALARSADSPVVDAVVLTLPRALGGLPMHARLTALGPDCRAIQIEHRLERLYDLGLGKASSSCCVRVSDLRLIRTLNEYIGQLWPDVLASIGTQILQASSTRVVLSPIGRIETVTKLLQPDERAHVGSETHFLPAQLALGRETPPGLDVPEHLIPCAIYYPEPAVAPEAVSPERYRTSAREGEIA